jgi:glycosyltransferase involved in cell wall biosynthesis
MSKKPLRVAMIAPPWLQIPAVGYGGVEAVLDGLIKGLVKRGIKVEVFGVGTRKSKGVKLHRVTKDEQFSHILKPMYDFSLPIPMAHVLGALNLIEKDGKFDIIHDNNYFIGPGILSWATRTKLLPPAIHTVHGPPISNETTIENGMPDNRPFWKTLGGDHNCYFVPISDAMRRAMPRELNGKRLDTVHNAIDVERFPFVDRKDKKNYFITLGRLSEEKGQHIAVELCAKSGDRLRMAGTVATIDSTRKLLLELSNPLSKYRNDRDFRYYSDKILPLAINNPKITYSGSVSGKKKMHFISEAKALLFPIQWEEPFGMAVIEALACGTPVVAMKRGAMPEIIEHGVNGFLANSEEEFAEYMQRVDEISPHACRLSVENNFSIDLMVSSYIARYEEVISRATDKPALA